MLTRCATLLVLVGLVLSNSAEGFDLLRDGTQTSRIVMLDPHNTAVKYAADDLLSDLTAIAEKPTTPSLDSKVVIGKVADLGDDVSVAAVNWARSELHGKWEAYRVLTRGNDLYILGSDTRGTMWGLYHFLESVLAVDPMYHWTDKKSKTRTEIVLHDVSLVSDGPSFKFRGWFVNDEDYLTEWKSFAGRRNNDYKYYAKIMHPEVTDKVIETALRLRMNMIIPSSFNDVLNPPEAYAVNKAAERGLIVTQHHIEPLGVGGFNFDDYFEKRGKQAPLFSYLKHPDKLEEVWERYVKASATYPDVIWQLGLRGRGDRAIWVHDPSIPKDDATRGAIISNAIKFHPAYFFDVNLRTPARMFRGLMLCTAITMLATKAESQGDREVSIQHLRGALDQIRGVNEVKEAMLRGQWRHWYRGEYKIMLSSYEEYLTYLIDGKSANHTEQGTRVSIRDGQWYINGRVICPGTRAEGLLMNVRMVNSVFEDRSRADFDAEANTDRFLAHVPDYAAHGVRAFTICLQGGMPGYEGAINSAFNPDGSLRESYLGRVRRVIEACDREGLVVLLGCFYQRQDQVLKDDAAVRRALVNVVNWLGRNGFQNVVLEIANEFDHRGFDHPILRSIEGERELIRLAKKTAPGLLVSTSGLGHGRYPDRLAELADFILIHFNGTEVEDIPDRIAALKKHGKPIVCNEDNKQGETAARAARLSVDNGASWGLMLNTLNQYFPLEFHGAADDPVVYRELKQLTSR